MALTDQEKQDLRRAFIYPKGFPEILERFHNLGRLVDAGELTQVEASELRVDAFRAMRESTTRDLGEARHVLLNLLLPHCLLPEPADIDLIHSVRSYRRELARWVDTWEGEGREDLLQDVLGELKAALDGPTPEPACWTIASIGYRDAETIDVLWRRLAAADRSPDNASTREDFEDKILAILCDLGPSSLERARLLDDLIGRAKVRCNWLLISAMSDLADPVLLGVVERFWTSPTSSDWSNNAPLVFRIPADIAAAHPASSDIQDRAWALIHKLLDADPSGLRGNLYLGSDVAPEIDCPRVVPDLIGLISHPVDPSANADHLRYLAYHRAGGCTRPRQLGGWAEALDPGILDVIREDARRDTESPGIYGTSAIDLKKEAWETLLSAGDVAMPTAESFDAALAEEANPHVRRRICEMLSCFRFDPLPGTAVGWVTERVNIDRDRLREDYLHRLSATEFLTGSATFESFRTLLNFGFTTNGGASFLASLEAVANVANYLAEHHRDEIGEAICTTAESGEFRHQRIAAAEAMILLACSDRLDADRCAFIPGTLRDADRDDSERARLVEVLGLMPSVEISRENVDLLAAWSLGHDQCSSRALKALGRRGLLLERPDILVDHLGLTPYEGTWRIGQDLKKSQRGAGTLGVLHTRHPGVFLEAVCDLLRKSDWIFAVQLLDELEAFGPSSPEHLNPPDGFPEILSALIDRIRYKHTRTTAEVELFGVLARWSPGTFAAQKWRESSSDWLPDARVALANALGMLPPTPREERSRVIDNLFSLISDGQFAVRRAAYRGLAHHDGYLLRDFCDRGVMIDRDVVLAQFPDLGNRRRAAEACAWLVEDDDFERIFARYAADPERSIREIASRSRRERWKRLNSMIYLNRLLEIRDGGKDEILDSWRFGRALIQIGDDATALALRRHLAAVKLPSNVVNFIRWVIEGVEAQWKKTAEKWPEPWLPTQGSVEHDDGKILADGREQPVLYTLWKQMSRAITPTFSWGGSVEIVGDFVVGLDTQKECDLVLKNGSRGKISITWFNSKGLYIFTGIGQDPS